MRRTSDEAQPVLPSRPLLIRPDVQDGEWLQTAISRWAHSIYRCSRQELLNGMGLEPLSSAEIGALGVALRPEVAAAISFATGVPDGLLHAMTIAGRDPQTWSNFISNANAGAPLPRRENQFAYGFWDQWPSLRWCASCMAEQPGVFKTQWRSAWTFLCLTHDTVLEDVCPTCVRPVRTITGRTREIWDPATCRNNLSGQTAPEYCGASLAAVEDPVYVGDKPRIVAAHANILILARRRSYEDLKKLDDVRFVIGVLRTASDELIADLAGVPVGSIRGLIEPELQLGRQVTRTSAAYTASKAGIVALTGYLAEELGPDRIRVNCIAPSTIDTEQLRAHTSPEVREAIARSFPLGRLGTTDDVAGAVLFLASAAAGWITGTTLDLAGGRTTLW